MRILFITSLISLSTILKAQKIDSIYFHLYTDSLKKEVYNYINIDGKLSNGRYLPLGSDKIIFSSNTGNWDGNSVIIPAEYKGDSLWVKAILRDNPAIWKTIIIYLKKNLDQAILKTEQEILDEIKKKKNK